MTMRGKPKFRYLWITGILRSTEMTFLHQVNPLLTSNCSSDRRNPNECSHNILTVFLKEMIDSYTNTSHLTMAAFSIFAAVLFQPS
jgi:hypothetical protein